MTNSYFIAKKAKKSIERIDRLGWPDTEEGIRRLIAQMSDAQITVCLEGRFIRRYEGWRFMFPKTERVIDVMEGRIRPRTNLMFVEDSEG